MLYPMPRYTKAEQEEAKAFLLEHLPEGSTVQLHLIRVSRSGMSRVIKPVSPSGVNLSWHVARVCDLSYVDGYIGGVRIGGCGMDMGFHLVHNLGYALFGDGFECTGHGCPSNDHSNGDRDYTPHMHKSGGYALKQSWM